MRSSSCLNRFWPVIDDALKKAAVERHIEVKVLASWWNHSRPTLPNYLRSLSALSSSWSGVNIEVVSVGWISVWHLSNSHSARKYPNSSLHVQSQNWERRVFRPSAGYGIMYVSSLSSSWWTPPPTHIPSGPDPPPPSWTLTWSRDRYHCDHVKQSTFVGSHSAEVVSKARNIVFCSVRASQNIVF